VEISSELIASIRNLDPQTAASRLQDQSDLVIGAVLSTLHTGAAVEILEEFPIERRGLIAAATPFGQGQLWLKGHTYPEGTVGRLMELPPAVFSNTTSIGTVIEALRVVIHKRMVTYILVTDDVGRLDGVVAFRELLFAKHEQTLADVMVKQPFFLLPDMPLLAAMSEVVTRHYPVYPVCDQQRLLLGMVKGQVLFEQQTFEISAQAGSMVGVEKEERIATPVLRSFWYRHPWLQLNLLTAFLAAAVVSSYQGTLNKIVLLAVFLPVVAGQCGNTATQTLAITLRAMTLNELRPGQGFALIRKEMFLGLMNGLLVGTVAGVAMWWTANQQGTAHAYVLGAVVTCSLGIACAIGGCAGVLIPLILRRMGADPATASGIFLSTVTDVLSMGAFLALATFWLL
jgi:magnesium transporter